MQYFSMSSRSGIGQGLRICKTQGTYPTYVLLDLFPHLLSDGDHHQWCCSDLAWTPLLYHTALCTLGTALSTTTVPGLHPCLPKTTTL